MTRLMSAAEVESLSAKNRAAHSPRTVDLGSSGKKKIGRPKGPHKPKPPSEHQEAVSLTLWVDFNFPMMGLDPRLFHAIPNGGHRHPAVGAKMKAEGSRAGYPDYGLDVARGGFHGLRIELKALDGRENDVQAECHELLRAQGLKVCVCYGAPAAIEVITKYLGAA